MVVKTEGHGVAFTIRIPVDLITRGAALPGGLEHTIYPVTVPGPDVMRGIGQLLTTVDGADGVAHSNLI